MPVDKTTPATIPVAAVRLMFRAFISLLPFLDPSSLPEELVNPHQV